MKKVVFLLFLMKSCSSAIWYYGDIDLGSGYSIAKEGKRSCVIYSSDRNYNGSGFLVIDENISDYKVNENLIVVKNNDKGYWVIDVSEVYNPKEKSNVVGPMDSITIFIQNPDIPRF